MRRLIALLMLLTAWPALADELSPLVIITKESSHRFWVELAETPEQKTKGLMNRTEIAPDGGMVFPFDPPREVSMWMKDTLIPLDMVFINDKNKIFRLREAKANDETQIQSVGKTAAVIELPSGTIKKFNIRLGDRVVCPCLKAVAK